MRRNTAAEEKIDKKPDSEQPGFSVFRILFIAGSGLQIKVNKKELTFSLNSNIILTIVIF